MLFKRLYLFLCSSATFAFNVAPEASLFASHTEDSYFGYSVALQNNLPRLVVGAPRSFSNLPDHRGLNKPGAVFSYSIKGYGSSLQLTDKTQLTLEAAGERNRYDLGYWDRKENAWIGGAMDVAESGENLVACGHRWKNQIHDGYYLMNGVCYSLAHSQLTSADGDKLIPLLDQGKQQATDNTTGREYFYYSYGQAGTSVHLTPEKDIVIGAPGTLHWLGSIIVYKQASAGRLSNPVIPNPMFTKAGNLEYLGYAVSSGVLLPTQRLIVASAPRTDYYGKVILFRTPTTDDAPLDIKGELQGRQMGEYFGATICVTDVDADGIDDILVGAPLYSSKTSHDVGIVYVYRNSMIWDGQQTPLELKGRSRPGARFGSAIASVGDLDLDGYQEIAVGAPYENHGDTTGSIYIYKCTSSGVTEEPSQIIKAADLKMPLRGFGISISRGLDIDGNYYPDFAVGAYESSHAVLLRTKPVVRLSTRVERSINKIHSNTSQFIVEVCLSYEGKHLPKYPYLVASVMVSVDRLYRRATVDRPGQVPIDLRAPTSNCLSYIVRLSQAPSLWPTHVRYAALPIIVKSLISSECPTCAVMDPSSDTTIALKMPVMSVCDKEECTPEWHVSAAFIGTSDPFVIGSADTLTVQVNITNVGDSSRLLRLNISIPHDVRMRSVPSFCENGGKTDRWFCLSGSRIDHGELRSMDLILDVTSLNSSIVQFNVSAESFDTNDTVDVSTTIPSIWLPRIDLSGRALPDLFVVRDSAPRSITHSYQTFCSGFTSVPGARMALTVPSRLKVEGTWQPILTLSVQANFGESNVNCTQSSAAPPMRVKPLSWSSTGAGQTPLSCGSAEIECTVVECEFFGTMMPHSEGLTVNLKMIVDGSVLETLLSESHVIELTTSVEASILNEAVNPVTKFLKTTFAGSIPEKSDPYLWIYIVVAVIAAIVLLVIIVYNLKKCGFFDRRQMPEEEEDAGRLYKEAPVTDSDADADIKS